METTQKPKLICSVCGTDDIYYVSSGQNGMVKYECKDGHTFEVDIIDLPSVEDEQQEELFPDEIIENVVIPLTEEEKIKLGNDLADLQILIDKKETEKKKIADEFNKEIKGYSSQSLHIARILEAGEDVKPTKCYWMTDDPEEGQKSLYVCETDVFVKTVDMTLFDSNLSIPENETEEEVNDAA